MYKQYNEYIIQNNAWIDSLPKGWNEKKIKYIVSTKVTDGPHTTPELLFDGVPFVSAEAVKDNRINLDYKRGYISVEDHIEFCKKCKPQKEDVFMVKSGATTGKVAYVDIDEEFSIWSPLALIRAKKGEYSQKYIFYSMLSKYFTQQVIISWNYGTQQNIGMGVIANLHLFVADYETQSLISDFLDKKTAKIRTQIEKINKMIDLLKEKKETLIINAITKGINPNVTLKDSGIEWIGEVPTHWEVKKIKHLCNLFGRIGWQGLTASEYVDEGPLLITGTDFDNMKINWNTCVHITEERYGEAKQIQIRNNDLLITKDGTIGKVAIVKDLQGKASLNSGVLLIRPLSSNHYNINYLAYILKSLLFWRWYSSQELGNSTIKHLYQEQFANFIFTLPPYKEQEKIVEYLDSLTNKVDTLIFKNEDVIKKLTEYQEALITAAVTGKIDVRGE